MHRRPEARALSGWVDPEAAFAVLAEHAPDVFWLDSGGDARDGWSMLGTGTPVDIADVEATRVGGAVDESWPAGPFRGGHVGWLDYERGAARAGAPLGPSALSSRWLHADRFLSFDHARQRVWLVADPQDADAVAWAATLLAATAAPVTDAVGTDTVAEARASPDVHAQRVARCREHIRLGDAYQLCLTTTFTVPGVHDAVAVARRLRERTRSHHGGFLRIDDTSIVSGSPEQFLTVTGETVRTKPIKGTRPRGTDPASDAALAADLRASEKERAENVMIVDLMRNDLSRICEPGTVRVEGLWQVESYPTVHQLVSTVAGRVRDGVTVGELWDATFPAGSMTGAPKLRAMQLLHDLEDGPRGVYAGCFGWVGFDGDLDLAMVIRTIVISGDHASVGSGGGITWGSVPAEEVAEVGVKVRAPLAALGASAPEGW